MEKIRFWHSYGTAILELERTSDCHAGDRGFRVPSLPPITDYDGSSSNLQVLGSPTIRRCLLVAPKRGQIPFLLMTIMVSSSSGSVPPRNAWSADVSRVPSASGELQSSVRAIFLRPFRPNSFPAGFVASETPSLYSTMRSPGCGLMTNWL